MDPLSFNSAAHAFAAAAASRKVKSRATACGVTSLVPVNVAAIKPIVTPPTVRIAVGGKEWSARGFSKDVRREVLEPSADEAVAVLAAIFRVAPAALQVS